MKSRAPEPKPAMTSPEARPRLSGNQSSIVWVGAIVRHTFRTLKDIQIHMEATKVAGGRYGER